MKSQTINLNIGQLDILFPFHFVLDNALRITACGSSLSSFCDHHTSERFTDHFEIVRPYVPEVSWQWLNDYANQLLIVKLTSSKLLLRGVLQQTEANGELIFLGFPWFNRIDDMLGTGLTFSKLGVLDPTADYLNLVQMHAANTEDAMRVLTLYKTQKTEFHKLSRVLENTTNGVVITSPDMRIEWVNKGFENLYGFTLDELKGKLPVDVLRQPGTDAGDTEKLLQAFAKGEPFNTELTGVKKDGSAVFTRMFGQAINDESGRLINYFSIEENITEQKLAADALEESRELWRYALEGSGDGIWIAEVHDDQQDADFRFSESYKKQFGYTANEEFDINTWKQHVVGSKYNEVMKTWLALTPEAPTMAYTYTVADKWGVRKDFITRGKVMHWNADGKPRKLVGTLTDITDIKRLEREATSSANRLSQLISNLQTSILLEDEHRKIVRVNENFCQLFSIPVPPEVLVGADCSQSAEQSKHLFDNPVEFVERINVILQERKLVKQEVMKMANGKILARDYIPILHEGNYLGHLWQYSDITEKVQTDEKLEKQRLFYEKILNEIPADIAIFSPNHEYLFVNKKAIKDAETRRWILGKTDMDYCMRRGKETSQAIKRSQYFQESVSSRQSVTFVDVHQRDDEPVHMLRVYYPYLVNNNIELVIGYGVDITTQKKQEQALELERTRMQDLLDVINDGIFRSDTHGALSFYNPAFKKIMQFTDDTPVNNLVQFVHPDYANQVQEALHSILGQELIAKGVFRLKDSEKLLDYVFTRLPGHSNQQQVVGRLSDVTEQVLKEENLGKLVAQEKELSDLKTRFIRITSHELRTPLSAILGYAEIMQILFERDNVSETQLLKYSAYIGKVVKEVNRMTELLGELILVGRIEEGREAFEFSVGNLSSYTCDIINDLFSPNSDGRKLAVVAEENTLNEVWFCHRMLRHAIINVLSNAFKYSTGRRAPVMRLFTSDGWVHIEVKDFGIGIPEEELSLVCNSFYRCSNAKAITGSGIGLMLTDYIVKAHKGTISIHSKLDEGTVVDIAFPVHREN